MKKVLVLLTALTMLMLTACGSKEEVAETKKEEKKTKIGLVLSTGGLGDKSFNDSAYAGLQKAEAEYGIEFKHVEPATPSEFTGFIDDFAAAGFDLVIAVGFDQESPLKSVAPNYPETPFIILDAVVAEPNVTSILFNAKEGSFMVGAVAGMVTKTNTIGYIGGIDMSFLNEFRDGYIQGAQYVNPEIDAKSLYIGGSNPFNDPAKAKEQSLSLKENGVDVIYGVAGGSGLGIFQAVNENEELYAIGVDANQDGEVEGKVLTSMMKRIDNALFTTIGEFVNDGNLKSEVRTFGIAEGGVSTTDFEFTSEYIGEENIAKLKEIEAKLISKEIEIK